MSGVGFWFIALAILAVLFGLWPLLSGNKHKNLRVSDKAPVASEAETRRAVNRSLYLERLSELDADLELKHIDEAQYRRLKAELDALFEEDADLPTKANPDKPVPFAKSLLLITAVGLPLISGLLYWQWGATTDWQIYQLNAEKVQLQNRGGNPDAIAALNRQLRDKLEARVEQVPDNLRNWFLLARTAFEQQDYGRAIAAYRHIVEQEPNAPQVWSELAQASYVAAGNRLTDDVQRIFDRALQLNPQDTSLLGLAGLASFESGDYRQAIDYWQRAASAMGPNNRNRQVWENAIERARRAMADAGQSPAGESSSPGTSVEVAVQLGEQVDADPATTVFVYARAWEGPPMPLAIQRLTVSDLPVTVELNESMAMAGMSMADFEQLEIVARISRSGGAQAQPGDWQATQGPVEPENVDGPIEMVIDEQL